MQEIKIAPQTESLENRNSILLQDLKDLKRFVVVDKLKRPIDSKTGRLIDMVDESKYVAYNTALNAKAYLGNAKYIGIALGKIDNDITITGIDVDYCVNKNGSIAKEALGIVNKFKSYTEYSLSGRGLHILIIGSKPEKKCKNSNLSWCKTFEIYDHSRHFVLTENVYNNWNIEKRQQELNQIYYKHFAPNETEYTPIETQNFNISSSELLQIGLKRDKKFQAYWNGERPSTDESRNDLGLMSKLIFWTKGNENLSIEAFCKSPYASQKDLKHRKKMFRSDYLRRTAQKCKMRYQNG